MLKIIQEYSNTNVNLEKNVYIYFLKRTLKVIHIQCLNWTFMIGK